MLVTLEEDGTIDDPLMAFTENCSTGRTMAFGETVNLSPLFTCLGALQDAEEVHLTTTRLRWLHEQAIDEATDESSWRRAVVDDALRSKIVMLESNDRLNCTADELRHQLHQAGVAVTVYSTGSIRLSHPLAPLTKIQRIQLATALGRSRSQWSSLPVVLAMTHDRRPQVGNLTNCTESVK